MEKHEKEIVTAKFIAGMCRMALIVVPFSMLCGVLLLVCIATSGCTSFGDLSLANLTPEQVEKEKADAQSTISLGQAIAEGGQLLPYPFNLLAAAGGGALVLLGGKKAAKLTGTAAKKVIVPAIAVTAGKILSKKTDAKACADTQSETENAEGKK
jgi:hypothetical protein